MQGNVVVMAVGLVVALAFSGLIEAFTTYVIGPLLNRIQGSRSIGLGIQLGKAGNTKTFMDFGSFISAIVYFVIFMAVIYFAVVVPYRYVARRRGQTVFGNPPLVKTCPACLSDDLPLGATKCKYCGSDVAPVASPPTP